MDYLEKGNPVNWIEIDKILFDLYDKHYAKSADDFYKAVMKRFNWDEKQSKTNTDLIIKQKSNL